MNTVVSAIQPLLRAVVRVDRAQISYTPALRNAVGVVVPLFVGAAAGQLLAGLTVSIGALQVAFSDSPGPYRSRVGRMLLAGLCAAASVFVGGATGALPGLAVSLSALWGFSAGLLVALGPAATQLGLTSVTLLLVFGARPVAPAQAAAQAGLVLVGGVLQTALAVAAWPVRPFGPQRVALAAAFRRLAAVAGAPADPRAAPPATAEITAARTILSGGGSVSSAEEEALRTLLDEAERIRLELLALADARHHADRAVHGNALVGRIDEALAATGEALGALADSLSTGRPLAGILLPLRRVEDAAHAPWGPIDGGEATWSIAARGHLEALAGQLRAAADAATQGSPPGEEAAARIEAARPFALRPREPLVILHANLTLRSAACRHALRLAGGVAVADALARGLALPRAYWVPMTVAFVLKPDFGATFTRGLGRIAGTALGLGLATLLVYVAFGAVAGRIALLGALVFVIRSVGAANYGLLAIAVTALVVVLTSFAGSPPEATIVERGAYTLVGGVLALVAYLVWPTWERTQTPAILADLIEAYRQYVAAVMAGYLDPRQRDPARLDDTRIAARLARTNAEASVARLGDEPARFADDLDRAAGLLANSHRFVHSVMALEAGLYHGPVSSASTAPALRVFAADVDITLYALARTLRDPSYGLDDLPDLRTDQRALRMPRPDDAAGDDAARQGVYPGAVLALETDRVVDSINTMTALLRRARSNL